jgi:hypothetical protein
MERTIIGVDGGLLWWVVCDRSSVDEFFHHSDRTTNKIGIFLKQMLGL